MQNLFSFQNLKLLFLALFSSAFLLACSSEPTVEEAEVAPKQENVVTELSPEIEVIDNTMNQHDAGTAEKFLYFFSPYKIDIQQGNFVSLEMANKLHKGMTKEQVRFILGEPLLKDIFHAERWDYLFRLKKANGQLTTNRLTTYFEDDLLVRIVSTNLPNENNYVSHITGNKSEDKD